MELVIVTGLSGSGKSTAFKMFEDFGYYCVDNLPTKMIGHFADFLISSKENFERVVLGVDIRGGVNIDALTEVLESLREKQVDYRLLFLTASDDCLLRRYHESRHVHPLSNDGKRTLEAAIVLEREMMIPLLDRANYVIDTSTMLTRELQQQLRNLFVDKEAYHSLNVTIMSFGYKFGLPREADYVFDARFLPNPYYDPELRPLTGNDEPIRSFVLDNEEARQVLRHTIEGFRYLIAAFDRAGKNQLVIAVGCTGGHHRSVAFANALYEGMKDDPSYGWNLVHKDIEKS
ncbi:MAG: RNase adapter RapZ [Lachnospiraceae bacterium]|nr:RNase adapter RapZ [Lachnospiraceae bacterium]